MEKLQKIYLTYYNLLKAQDLWQAHHQILLIIFLKDFIKLNVNTDRMIKKCVTYIIKYQHFNCFLEYTNFKDDLLNTYVYIVTKIINKSLMKNQRNNFLI